MTTVAIDDLFVCVHSFNVFIISARVVLMVVVLVIIILILSETSLIFSGDYIVLMLMLY